MTNQDELLLAADRLRTAQAAFYDAQHALERAWVELRDADGAFRKLKLNPAAQADTVLATM